MNNGNYNPYDFDSDYVSGQYAVPQQETIGTYTAKTFLWMFFGLLLTFGVAFLGYYTGSIYYVLAIPYFSILLLVAELAVVIYLAARIERLRVNTARVLFLAYAVLNGIVFSTYFLIFEVVSLILIFAATAVYFGAMAAYGFFTKTDLSRLRPILTGGVIFLLAFAVLSLFLPFPSSIERLYCLAGIAIFLGFTAYDTQKIRAFYGMYSGNSVMLQKASIFSALQLYLDFINLFLYLLRFLGRSKQ